MGDAGRGHRSRADLAFAAAALAILALAAFERLRLPLLPYMVPDGWEYLRAALHLLDEGEVIHFSSRQFLYPVLLAGMIAVGGGVGGIVLVQHALAIAGGALLLAAWMRLPMPGPRTGAPARRVQQVLGLLLMASHLLLGQSIVYEHHVQPEGLAPFFWATMLYGLVATFDTDPRTHPGRFVGWATLGLFAANVGALLRPQALFVVPAVGLLTLAFAWRRGGLLRAGAAVGIPAVLAVALLWGPEIHLSRSDPVAARVAAGRFLFWHFHLAAPLIEEDLASGTLPEREASLRRDLLDAYADEQVRHRDDRYYPFQNYNPCALYYGEAGRILTGHFADDAEGYADFANGHFRRGVARDPLGYLGKIGNNLATYYRWPDGLVYNPRSYIKVRAMAERLGETSRANGEWLSAHAAGAAFIDEAAALAPPVELSWVLGEPVRKRYFAYYATLGQASTVALVALLAGLMLPARRGDAALAWGAALGAVAVFGANLTASAIHGLETPRYVLAMAILSMFATWTGLALFAVRGFGALAARLGWGPAHDQGSIGP